MTDVAACSHCGCSLSRGETLGSLCPACLVRLALQEAEPSAEEAQDGGSGASHVFSDHIGPYRILSFLGEGGMGVVYLAEQERPIARTVALKVVKLGMDSREVLARFDSERLLLARMSHANIARVLDAGTSEDGRPYFVMEYIAGVPITQYCDANHLPIRDRLALFIPVCRALQHAHQKAVIHRDLKPSNVLVALEDGRPVPKVIDFGIAKAVDRPQAERTAFTRNGVMLGTPEYMSPEQADGGTEVDTTTDVYSLGVILYELLIGVLPFKPRNLREAGYGEMLRIIREEEPTRPSSRLTTLGADASEVERSRATRIPSLRKQLRGDLDWITLRALEKDRARRYPSASEFAADIEHYLSDDPVTASPARLLYRAGKVVRKHRAAVLAVAAILTALCGGLIASVTMYLRASNAQREAERQGRIADEQSYVANLGAAEVFLRSYQTGEALGRLTATRPALRGWEWNYLWRKATASDATIVGDRPVNWVRFAKDANGILWLNDQGLLRAADVAPYRPRSLWPRSTFAARPSIVAVNADASAYVTTPWSLPLASVTFGRTSRNGPYVLVANPGDGSAGSRRLTVTDAQSGLDIAQLDLPSIGRSRPLALSPADDAMFNLRGVADVEGRPRLVTSGREGTVVSGTFSPDGRFVATWTWDSVLRLWNVPRGSLRATFVGHQDGISEASFSPDGSRIASASHDGTVRIWTLASPNPSALLRGHRGGVTAVAWSPDGRHLATGGTDNTVRWWSASGRLDATLKGHTYAVTAVAVMPDGRRIVSASVDRTIRYWDTSTGLELAVMVGHRDEVRTVAAHSDGLRIVSGSSDGTVRVWRTPAAQPVPGGLLAVAASAAGTFVTVTKDGSARLWAVDRSAPIATLDGPNAGPVAMSASGQAVVLGSRDHTLRVWNIERRKVLTLRARSVGIRAVALNADGTRLAFATNTDGVRVWDVLSEGSLHLESTADVDSLLFSPDGRWLAGAEGKRLTIWDAWSGAEHWRRDSTEQEGLIGAALAFSADSQKLAVAPSHDSTDRSIRIWRIADKTLAASLSDQDKPTISLTFDGSGRRLISAYEDGTIQVWDLSTRKPVLNFTAGKAVVRVLQFAADGERLLAITPETARVLDGSPIRQVVVAR